MSLKKKIALIGNMNNMLFQQQRYFEDWGYDTTLFLLEEFNHFLPEADVFFDPYQKYKIIKLNWNIENFYSVSKEQILGLFTGFDLLVGTDLAPAYLYKAGLKLDIFCLHGNDLYEYPFFRFKDNQPSLWEVNRTNFSICQYEGIKLSKYVALNKSDALYEQPLAKIRNSGARIASGPYLYLPQFTSEYFEKSDLASKMKQLRSKFDFLIFHHCAHNWESQKNSLVYKGNDRLIKGFANYIHRSIAKKKGCLIMLEYGPDVELSKQLINELGISENVYWFPKQQRKDLLSAINLSDIGVGELGKQGWIVYSVIVEFLIFSKPVIHYRNSKLYEKDYKDLYPMTDTNDPEAISQMLLDFEKNPVKYITEGKSANEWYFKNIQEPSLNDLKEKALELVGKRKQINFLEKILHSNKIDAFKIIYWKLFNILKIKLRLQHA